MLLVKLHRNKYAQEKGINCACVQDMHKKCL